MLSVFVTLVVLFHEASGRLLSEEDPFDVDAAILGDSSAARGQDDCAKETSCSGWEPTDGDWAGKGGSCDNFGMSRKWCWVPCDYRGPGKEFIQMSMLYPGKTYTLCGGLEEDTSADGVPVPGLEGKPATAAEAVAQQEAEAEIARKLATLDTPDFDPVGDANKATQKEAPCSTAETVPTLEIHRGATNAAMAAVARGACEKEVEASAKMAAETAKAEFACRQARKKAQEARVEVAKGRQELEKLCPSAVARLSPVGSASPTAAPGFGPGPIVPTGPVSPKCPKVSREEILRKATQAAKEAKAIGLSESEVAKAAGRAAGEAANPLGVKTANPLGVKTGTGATSTPEEDCESKQ